ncbi:Pentatricopeptide repeat-containing protein [Asimina triloba]
MKNRGIWPDQYTFAPLLKSCSQLSDPRLGRGVHAEALTGGFESHTSVQIGLIELYVNCGRMEDAQQLFDNMPTREVVAWNLMIRGFCRGGDADSGIFLFRQMGERSIVSWNSMIAGFAQAGRDGEALGLFQEMLDAGLEADDATLVTVLPVCARLGSLDVGRWIHAYADGKGLLKEFATVGNSLVDMYCKCGDLAGAQACFCEMSQRNVVSWNAMISGLAFNGRGELGIDMFRNMMQEGIKPDASTFMGVLGCCTHAGLVQTGRELFDSMIKEHKIEPRPEHYGCMVDLLGRHGHVKETYGLIRSMPMKANAAIWGALLSACRIYGDLDTAEYAAKELVHLEPWNSGNYVLLSNIYAEAERWDDVEKVRVLMREMSVQKAPGQSMVESCDYLAC